MRNTSTRSIVTNTAWADSTAVSCIFTDRVPVEPKLPLPPPQAARSGTRARAVALARVTTFMANSCRAPRGSDCASPQARGVHRQTKRSFVKQRLFIDLACDLVPHDTLRDTAFRPASDGAGDRLRAPTRSRAPPARAPRARSRR